MHYVAIVGEEERQVEVTELSPGRFQIIMDGRTLQVDARAVSDATLSLLHEHQGYEVAAEAGAAAGAGEDLFLRGHVVNVEVLDLRNLRLRKAQAVAESPDGPVSVTAPMPGKVVAVLVREGEEVAEGQGLLVVEAMKMENELRAPRAGRVTNLTAQEGAAVDAGVSLCVVE